MQRDIKIKWFYPYPPETIWEHLTNPELLQQWTSIKEFEPIVGFEFEQHERPKPSRNWNGIMYHKIIEIIPLKRLSYTFQGGPKKGIITLDTIVTWILEPKENGTELRLEHTGFKGTKNYITSFIMELGWKNHIAKKFKKTLLDSIYDSQSIR